NVPLEVVRTRPAPPIVTSRAAPNPLPLRVTFDPAGPEAGNKETFAAPAASPANASVARQVATAILIVYGDSYPEAEQRAQLVQHEARTLEDVAPCVATELVAARAGLALGGAAWRAPP